MHVFFIMSIFRLSPRLKLSFKHKTVRNKLFLDASFCLDFTLSLLQMDQKFKFGVTIGYGDSNLEFSFRHFKVLRLHGIINDAAEANRAHSGNGPE